jgi:hypothetical protein
MAKLSDDKRGALELLAGSQHGCNEAMLIAHDFPMLLIGVWTCWRLDTTRLPLRTACKSIRPRMSSSRHLPEIYVQCVSQDLRDVLSPFLESLLALRQELMPLINCSHPGNRSSLVIENLIGDVWGDAEASHPGDARSP